VHYQPAPAPPTPFKDLKEYAPISFLIQGAFYRLDDRTMSNLKLFPGVCGFFPLFSPRGRNILPGGIVRMCFFFLHPSCFVLRSVFPPSVWIIALPQRQLVFPLQDVDKSISDFPFPFRGTTPCLPLTGFSAQFPSPPRRVPPLFPLGESDGSREPK